MTIQKQNQQDVFEVAIIGRVKWNLHSLSNEGTIGNVTEPRTVVLWDGTKTDGISGEMMKHIHAFWTWMQARQNNLPLCDACQKLQPQRADAAQLNLPRDDNVDAMKTVITTCTLCDLHGFLVQRPTINRQSTVEFSWIVGIPEQTQRDLHIHARHAPGERGAAGGQEEQQAEGEEQQTQQQPREVAAQMVYHRPTRSGVYAFVTLFQPWRIGLNEVDYSYVLNKNSRKKRYDLVLNAYEWIFKRPDGAMTTTRLPHSEGVEGVLLVARTATPVPILSPLREDYCEKLKQLAQNQEVEAHEFNDMVTLTKKLKNLKERRPFRLRRARRKQKTGGHRRRRGG